MTPDEIRTKLMRWPSWNDVNAPVRLAFIDYLGKHWRPSDFELDTMWHWFLRGWNASRSYERGELYLPGRAPHYADHAAALEGLPAGARAHMKAIKEE